MNSITFKCEVVTPMFLAGADGREPELRAPSIKGAMRFWWRAMHGDTGVKALREREAEIFGGGGDNARRSQIAIKITENKVRQQKCSEFTNDNNTGIRYLFFAPLFLTNRDGYRPDKDRTFKISFASINEFALQEAIKAFAFLVFFGGIGSRTRRGAGVIAVKEFAGNAIDSLDDILKVFNTKEVGDVDSLKAHLEATLKSFMNNSAAANGKYSSVIGSSVYLLEPKDDWKNALEVIGRVYKTERNRLKSQVEKTPNFGFPIQHRKTSTKPKLTMGCGVPYKKDQKWKIRDFSDRRSSPLIITLIKTQNDKFFPVALNLTGELLPSGKKIVDKYANELNNDSSELKKRRVDSDGLYIMKEFLEKLKEAPDLTL